MRYWSVDRRTSVSSKSGSDHRNPFEHDYDRLLFSTPVRRLADKTQVFPLDKNDGVRTRLTHSHEVANLARSMGNRLFFEGFEFEGTDQRSVAAILSAIGLAHDIGNPPFGHQGDAAIGHWFKENPQVFNSEETAVGNVPEHLQAEFLKFEGNAQTIRILTRLQVQLGGLGLDWTAATIGALMKYTVSCDALDNSNAASKKFGYFESEHEIVTWMREKTGLMAGQRHPLTWLMECADDIAYATLDIEDAIRKNIISPDDVRALINHHLDDDYPDLVHWIDERFIRTREQQLSIPETREVMSSYLRTAFIDNLIREAIESFKTQSGGILNCSHSTKILKNSTLLSTLKKISQNHVFVTTDVRKIEADGYQIIGRLMDFYWYAITNRESPSDMQSRRTDAKSAFGISKISDNYLQCAVRGGWRDRNGDDLPIRYRELRLLTDMVSGMTDGFAKSEYDFLSTNGFL